MAKYCLCHLVAIVWSIFSAGQLYAYSFMPLVTAYASHENNCATQSWSSTQDSNGKLYYGTTDGLLSFDGVRWESLDLPGIHTIRSVKAIGNRVYIGSYEDFGYVQFDATGQPVYHSLRELISDYEFHDDEFWSIVAVGNDIYFQSFRSIFRYDGEKVESLYDPEHSPLFIFNVGGSIIAQLIYGGLATVDKSGLHEYVGRELFGGSDVVSLLDAGDGRMIACTEGAGLFIIDDRNAKPLRMATDIDDELASYSVNRALMMSDSTIVVGTIRNGVYALAKDGHLKWHLNIENGLGNNSVLGLFEDCTGNLWVSLDHGISLVHSGLSYSFLRPGAGEPYIGMTYGILRSGNTLYIGTNQGLYAYDYATNKISADDKMKSQIWHLNRIDNEILVGGGTLSARIRDGKVVSSNTNSSTDIKKGIIHNREVLIESSYYVLRVYLRNAAGEWEFSHDVSDFGAPVRQIEIDSDGSIWCSHLSRGVMRLELSSDLKRVVSSKTFKHASPGKVQSTTFVMKIRGNIALSDGDSLYRYDADKHSLVAMHGFNNDLPSLHDIYSSTAVDDRLFWLSSRKAYTLVSYNDGHYRRELSIPLDYLSLQSNGVNNCVYVDDNRNCYFAINNGVGCVSLDKGMDMGVSGFMNIAGVEHVSNEGIIYRLPLNSDKTATTDASGNISFIMSYPAYNFKAPKFIYRLSGPDEIERESDEPRVDFAGLRHGQYHFMAAMIDDNGNYVAQTDYAFTVPTPAYLSYWAMSGYALGLIALVFGISKLYSARQIKRQRREHEIESAAATVKILEQERIIAEQQKQLLENELSLKSKELASLALEAGYKHQIINNLRETINDQRRKGHIGSSAIDTLIKTINTDISNSEFWEIFQNNFDLIHENFFHNLRQRYPELTATDLKFCALLRMNMSTKDIAKFTQLTVRGVETARYRLRRKLGLGSNDSIVQFLIDFKE